MTSKSRHGSGRREASAGIIILAAGQGKRMRSSLPKVLHSIGGQPILFHILDRVREVAPHASVAIVVGHGREKVEQAVRSNSAFSSMALSFIHQKEQRGTGDAARSAMDSAWGEKILSKQLPVLVLPGDFPLLPVELIEQMLSPLNGASNQKNALRLLTCHLSDPTGYGRVMRKGKGGPVLKIVEEKDASLKEKAISEVANSIYTFQSAFLKAGLQKISSNNAQGEFYLTDLIAQASRLKKKIDVVVWKNPEDLRGVNDPWELALAEKTLNERCVRGWARQGVRFIDPASTRVDVQVKLAEEVVIQPGAILSGKTEIGRGTTIGPNVVLKNMLVGEDCNIKAGSIAEDSSVGNRVSLGPYAHLRPESRVDSDAKIGNFVELKKSSIGEKTSVAHLSYLGDAEVGKGVNIGCGFVTCNFDGRVIEGQRKHRTIIEDDVFMGSDCQALAPVRIGKGSYVASGSTISEDVEPGSLAIARSRQVNKPGYASKLKSNAQSEKS